MCYVLTDNNFYIGKDFRGRPTAVKAKDRAFTFKTGVAADNFLRCIPDNIKRYNCNDLPIHLPRSIGTKHSVVPYALFKSIIKSIRKTHFPQTVVAQRITDTPSE